MSRPSRVLQHPLSQPPHAVSRRTLLRLAGAGALVPAAGLTGLTGCTPATGGGTAQALRILVPNAAGGGYDTTARIAANVLEEEGIAARPEIFNLEGAGGAVGLARTVHERGNADLLLMMGLGVVGSVHANRTAVGLDQVTPVARLLSEPEVLLVPAGTGRRDLRAVLRAWRSRPGSLVVGGGSLPGGPDHLATYLLAETVGLDPTQVRYRRYDGGGPLLAALFSGQVDVAVSGVLENMDQIRAGAVRVLAVTGRDRVPGVPAPTLREAGVDLELANWRGLVAPPGLTDEQRRRLVDLATRMHGSTAWQDAVRRNGWTDDFTTGEAFGAFLAHESRRVSSVVGRVGGGAGQHG